MQSPVCIPKELVCAQGYLGGGSELTGHCQVGLLLWAGSSLLHTHSHWPHRDLGSSALSRATLPSVRVRPSLPPKGGNVPGLWLCPKAPWTPVLRAPAARPASRQGSCTTSPNYVPNTVWQPGKNSRTLYILAPICLPAVWLQGQACLCGPREMGVC